MSKEEQKAAAKRIMAKLGPMTMEEQERYEQIVKNPESYRPPDTQQGTRWCGVCGAKFTDERNVKGELIKSALEKFTDHQVEHNPSPGRWSEAYKRIQDGKARSKESM